jgi:hypothetical protein
VVQGIDTWLEKTMHQDDLAGATGEWIALLGFSQGAKVSASLLYRQQCWKELFGTCPAGINFRFGILLAGQAPFISMDPDLISNPPLPDASQITDLGHSERELFHGKGHVLRIPTLHVHGLRDKGLDHHRKLFEDFCTPQSRRLIEWDGDHRVPLKRKDVSLVVHQIRELAKETGVA